MAKSKLKKNSNNLPLFDQPLKKKAPSLYIEEGKYYYTRGGWIAKVVYVNDKDDICYAVHNPKTPFEVGPVLHMLSTGFAAPLFSIVEPPAYTGHPADLIKEAEVQ
uniref:Uncharacterized protein n=1 Tax=Dictyoglomus turgidum TaxID=513050 RepID=A0A7C3WM24_9BACT